MPADALDLLHTQYSSDFWRRHALSEHNGSVNAVPRFVQRRATGASIEILFQDQMKAKAALERALASSKPSADLNSLVTASVNVQSFNEAFPKIPKLAHPAVLIKGAVDVTVKQLNYEYTQLEMGNWSDALEVQNAHTPILLRLLPEAPAKSIGDWQVQGACTPNPPAKLRYDFEKYDRLARASLQSDHTRLEFKYNCLEHLASAAYHHIEMPRDLAQKYDLRVLFPPHKKALKELQKSIKRSLRAAQQDLQTLEDFYSRAAKGAMQLQRLSPSFFSPQSNAVDASHTFGLGRHALDSRALQTSSLNAATDAITPMRLPNLFGPGELLIDTASNARRLYDLYETTFNTVDILRTQVLRPRTSELAYLDKAYTRLLLAGRVEPIVLGPMDGGSLFNRDPRRLKE